MESKQGKLERFLSLNRMKHSRVVVMHDFNEQTGINLTANQFLSQSEIMIARIRAYQIVKNKKTKS